MYLVILNFRSVIRGCIFTFLLDQIFLVSFIISLKILTGSAVYHCNPHKKSLGSFPRRSAIGSATTGGLPNQSPECFSLPYVLQQVGNIRYTCDSGSGPVYSVKILLKSVRRTSRVQSIILINTLFIV